eukprot:1038763-Rhodomonas_salina.1
MPSLTKPRLLPGHHELLRELDALFTMRKLAHSAIQQCETEGRASLAFRPTQQWQVRLARRKILKERLPCVGVLCDETVWKRLLWDVNSAIDRRRSQHKKETDKHEQDILTK